MAVIRVRTESDLEGCAESLRAVYRASGYPVRGISDPVAFISSPDAIQAWVAETSDGIVGHVMITKASSDLPEVVLWRQKGHDGEVACLGRLFVHPKAQGLGIAAKLMTTAVQYAATQSTRLLLYNLEKDTIARRMYAKLGWIFFGNFQFEWDETSMNAHCFVSPALT